MVLKKKYPQKQREYREKHREKRNQQKREWYQKNKEWCLEYAKEYSKANQKHIKKYMRDWARKNYFKIKERKKRNYPEKLKARSITNGIIRKIPVGTICEICNENLAVHKHHLDYSKPLLFKFVCRKCHNEFHRKENL
jgi:hypothetical protein